MKRFVFLFFIFSLITKILQAQYYVKGQDPASIRWKEINSKHFQVLFPENYSKEGQRLTNILEYSFPHVSEQLDHQPAKIPVIVHNYSTISNGFVSWAPKRIELYPTPDPASHPQESLEQLSLHELRHVVQLDKLKQGFTGLLSYIMGQQAIGGITGTVPFWLLEGDAVYGETYLSHSGRGSMPSFNMKLRAISLEKEDFYSFEKIFFGSYKNYIPDYYQYGYQMVSYGRQEYGENLWSRSIDDIARYPFSFFPLHFSLKKQTDLSKKELFNETFNYLQKKWKKQNSRISFTEFDTINRSERKSYTSYRFPQYINDSIIVAEKSGISQIKEFITINARTGEEKLLHKPGYYQSVRLSAGGNKIVWTEKIPDHRWGNRSYSDIKVFDITKSIEKRLTRKKRYFSPAISAGGEKIVAVEINEKNESFLIILDALNGNTIQKLGIPENLTPMMPEWSEKDGHIYLIILSAKGKSICEIDPVTGNLKTWLKPGFDDIKNIVPLDNYILFHASYSGKDNIYALKKNRKELLRITSSRFGAFDVSVSPDTSQIVFSDYSSKGYNLGKTTFNPYKLKKTSYPETHNEKVTDSHKKFVFCHDSVPETEYEITPYKKGWHLFNFHSWMPFYFDLDNFELTDPKITPGITLLSQNRLSTAITTLGYEYRDNHHFLHSKFSYKGWYPVIDLSANYGGLPLLYRDSLSTPLPEKYSKKVNFRSKIYFPLNLTHNRFNKTLIPSFETIYTNSFLYNSETREYDKGRFLLNYRLYYQTLLKLSHRDFQPRWGQVFDINFLHSPIDNIYYGNDFSFRSVLYFPGFFNHDGIKIKIGKEKQNPKKFLFYNNVSFPRGYENIVSEELTSFSGEYSVPLLYPDLNLFTLAYLKRFRGSVFIDYATGKRNHDLFNKTFYEQSKKYLSVGGGLLTDIHFFRIPFPVSIGFEYAYMPYKNTYDLRFLFEMNIYGFAINRSKY